MTQDDATQLQQKLDARSADRATKPRDLHDNDRHDTADFPHQHLPIAPERERGDLEESTPDAGSLIAKEIAALGERFRLWLARTDQKYLNDTINGERNRYHDLGHR
jgi:hypothetical protein